MAPAGPGRTRPQMRTPLQEDTSGRGLWLVDKLATGWGVEPVPEGKRVWFELTR